ncbi:MAG: hypothetical protein F6J97_04880 [Leptolyngbya sp. SIO4C1]|nr:hypothetical protein [Leptolyngbya sp. SIO4C1]
MDRHEPTDDLSRREQALKAREIQIRMRELEAELDPAPVHPTRKHRQKAHRKKAIERQTRPWYLRLGEIGKFCLIVIAVIVAIRIAARLATIVIVLGVAWAIYKLFFGRCIIENEVISVTHELPTLPK